MLERLRNFLNPHHHYYARTDEQWCMVDGNLAKYCKTRCDCGAEGEPVGLLIATAEDLAEAQTRIVTTRPKD